MFVVDIPGIVESLRKTFASDKTRSREWRLQQLHNFLRMLDEEGPALCEAMLQDLHKSPLEGYLTELGLVKAEVETAIENLDKWMTPTKTQNSALNIPCWSTTQRDPLGVVLIMGAWNYPMQVLPLLLDFFIDSFSFLLPLSLGLLLEETVSLSSLAVMQWHLLMHWPVL